MNTMQPAKQFLSGNEALALAALHAPIDLGTGYPGTPSTEILEHFADLGGKAQWAPNEKVAAEVGLGVAFAGGHALVTMKHVGLNVAADVLYTATYSGVQGSYVLVSADDPGMASSQNEQDSRRHAHASGAPMLEPSSPQEAYAYLRLAVTLSARWEIPVLLRMSTRVCHSYGVVQPSEPASARDPIAFTRAPRQRVMIPGHARPAHLALRAKLDAIRTWSESAQGPNQVVDGSDHRLGIITSGVSYWHVREAAPTAGVFKVGMPHPFPAQPILDFIAQYERCIVVEENDPYLVEQIRTAGGDVPVTPTPFRFGELDVNRVRKLLAADTTLDPAPPAAKPPELCQGCPHRASFQVLKDLDLIVAGDIGCYTLAVLPPLQAMDTQICMGASIGVGLGLRHTLPESEARRVVSVIGDSTFIHSGLTGIAEMVYNPPSCGHVVIILDNSTTAMTGLQEHPGTGRGLAHARSGQVSIEQACRGLGVDAVHLVDPVRDADGFREQLRAALASDGTTVFIARQPCVLAAPKIRQYEQALKPVVVSDCAAESEVA